MNGRALITSIPAQPPAILQERARKYARASMSAGTLRMYGYGWAEFEQFARQHHAQALPASPSLVIDYLTSLADAGAAVATIDWKRAAIVYIHKFNHQPNPCADEDVILVMRGIRHVLGVAPDQKDALTINELIKVLRVIPADLRGKRDRALILLGYAGAFRSSELAALTMADIRITDALRVMVRKSKTDQSRAGFVKVIPLDLPEAIDPVTALTEYLDEANITKGPLWRRCNRWGLTKAALTKQSVSLIVKRHSRRAGLDPQRFTGHSLRAGFITTAYDNNARTFEIMELTGQKSDRTVAKYVRYAGKGAQSAVRAAFTK